MTAPATPHRPSWPASRRWRHAVLALAGIALFLGFVALGTWQVQRRAWKLALIERVDQRVHASPVAFPPESQWQSINAADHEYLPVVLRGTFDDGKTVFTQAVTELGAGFWMITALRQDDGTHVLVNRGFVPAEQQARWKEWQKAAALPKPGNPGIAKVQGLVRMSEPHGGFLRSNDPAGGRWYSRDVAAIAGALQLDRTAPVFIDAGLPEQRPGQALAPADTWPRPGMTIIRFHNSHLVYALTWYGLALMVAGAGWYVARYERRLRHRSGETVLHDPPPR